ncbi:SRPBCC family protein [Solirubrobacter soli]|uniref:SRPBCC family protein n=1 Tax=Solirubrobacter soli TaxID=363832 RepID=UPI000404D145|nr:SRPBCC family protein [Solirubrobacter soli]
MIDFTLESRFDRSPTDVFDYVSDPERLPTWQTNTVSSVPDGPMAVGTRLREVHRMPGGKEVASVVEVSEFEPGRVFALRVVEGTPVHLRITLDPDGDGTRMRFRAYGELGGAMRLLQPVLGRTLKRQFAQQLDTLGRVLS